MAIKTDELQTITAPQAADTLLLADSAGGTAQLSMAQAAAFFGAEMVKADNPVGAALSSKAAKSAQETVEKTSVSSRTVELAAEDLPAFIAGLPRLLAEHLTVKVSGNLTVPLVISGFYGSGSLWIEADSEGCTTMNSIRIVGCKTRISLVGLIFQTDHLPEGIIKIVSIEYSDSVFLSVIMIDGNSGLQGVSALNSMVRLNDCCIKNCDTAVLATGNSVVSVFTNNGSEFSGNTTGAYVWHGGIVLLSAVPDTLGGATNLKQGGIIIKGDGTLL